MPPDHDVTDPEKTTHRAAGNLRYLWATPFLIHPVNSSPEFRANLEETILKVREGDPGIRRANHGPAWSSSGNLLEWNTSETRALKDYVSRAMADCLGRIGDGRSFNAEIFAWANVLEGGGYQVYHRHPNNHFSGVYYLRAGENPAADSRSGWICFHEPRASAGTDLDILGLGTDFEHKPEEDTMLLFPSYLGHSVHPYSGSGLRVTIAFNILLRVSES